MIKEFVVVNTAGTVATIEATGLLKAVGTVTDIVARELPAGFTFTTRRQNTRYVYPIVVDVNVYDESGQARDDLCLSVHRDLPVEVRPFARELADSDA